MNTFAVVVLCLAVASASAGHLGLGYAVLGHHEAHIPSGSVSVSHDGAVIAGPSGSIKTNNGIHGVASAQISGPSGDIATHGGYAHLAGPGQEHYGYAVAPVAHHSTYGVPPVAHHTVVAGPSSHTTIVGPSAHTTIVAPGWGHYSGVVAAPAWGHYGEVVAAPAWGHHNVVNGHYGW